MALERNCGNCQRWGKEADTFDGERPCMALSGPMPFWLELDDGQQWTGAMDGKECRAFEPKEEA